MIGLSEINTETLRKIIPEIISLIPSVTFIYLFLTTHHTYLLWLSIIAVFFLGFELNYHERMGVVMHARLPKTKNPTQQGFSIIKFYAHDLGSMFLMTVSYLLTLIAFVILVTTTKDVVAWILLFSCLLAGFYLVTAIFTYTYIVVKYPRFGGTIEKIIQQKTKSYLRQKKTLARKCSR